MNSTIKSGDLTYQNEDNVKQILVPIYKEEDCFFDVSSSKGKSGKKTVLKNPAGQPIFGAGLEETGIFFDVKEAKSLLDDAIPASTRTISKVRIKPWGGSRCRRVVRDEVDLPLERARMNLLEASRLAAADRFKEAEAFLHRTVGALETYEAEVGGETSKKARALINSVNAVGGKLEQDKAGAKKKISGFLTELSSWL